MDIGTVINPVIDTGLEEMRETARRVVHDELMPLETTYLKSRNYAYSVNSVENLRSVFGDEVTSRLIKLSKDLGFWDLAVPAEHGGPGLSALAKVVIEETLNYCAVPLPIAFVPNILFHCNEEQVGRVLRPVVEGKKSVAYAQTEADAGSDPGGMMRTNAKFKDGHWWLNGSKMWISSALQSDYLLVLAVTDPEKRQRGGITVFIVDRNLPGVHIEESGLPTWLSPRTAQYSVTFDDVCLNPEDVIGGVGQGFTLGQRFLMITDRLMRGPYALGKMQRALDLSVAWARERVTFGRPIAERQGVQWKVVDMFVDIQALRSITYETAVRADGHDDIRAEAALVKLCAGDWGARCLDNAIQVHGAMGESLELPLTYFYRLLKHAQIGGGTSEIQRVLIARQLLGRGGS